MGSYSDTDGDCSNLSQTWRPWAPSPPAQRLSQIPRDHLISTVAITVTSSIIHGTSCSPHSLLELDLTDVLHMMKHAAATSWCLHCYEGVKATTSH